MNVESTPHEYSDSQVVRHSGERFYKGVEVEDWCGDYPPRECNHDNGECHDIEHQR